MKTKTTDRLASLDALRGFDMFWIAGGALMVSALAKTGHSGFIEWLNVQTEHVEWNGFHFFDMIFPLFLFIAGVTFPFSLRKRRANGQSSGQIYKHIITRGLVLVFLGIVYNGLFRFDFDNLRYASVLGRIGLAWMFAALIVMNANIRWQAIWCAAILLAYWAILMLIPVPGYGAGVLTVDGSIVGYVDRMLLPGKLYLGVHDPEGILSTIPAISTALLGMLTGHLLKIKNVTLSPNKKLGIMAGAGVVFILLSLLWNLVLPINKNLWTSSFVMTTAGFSLLFLSFFYLVMDIWHIKWWAFPFVVIGLNPITIYLAQAGMISFTATAQYFFGGLIRFAPEANQPFWSALAYFLVSWLFLYFLYRKKIFLKV
ncbi:MAG TPA: DUF5009 domain-containing protein [Bacteroidales bacterium]|nr:DUF5009 domain-containing protein [Bacteroidales bacterium]